MKNAKYVFLSATALFLMSCGGAKNSTAETETLVTETLATADRPLEKVLNERKENFANSASDEKKQSFQAGLDAINEKHIVENALQVGDTAINFTLPNATGKSVTLYDELKNGPVILMWYRGGWCPYCNFALHYMQESLPEFKAEGASLIAISPEIPDKSMSTIEKNELEFEVVSDANNGVAKQYKVVYKLSDEVAKRYEEGFGLSSYNGTTSGELPLAVTYIIGQDGVIKYAFLDANYRNRAEPQDILDFLKTMK